MNLPQHYFPVRVCPHIGEGKQYRFKFAECGCHGSVNVSVQNNGESVIFLPQKGQGSVKNLAESIPSLPLFNHPLNDLWKEWDSILGMKNYNEMQGDLTSLFRAIPVERGRIKNIARTESLKRFRTGSEIIRDAYHSGYHDVTQLPAKQYDEIQKILSHGLNKIYTRFERAVDACEFGTSCLKGYNRDFYGGLLSVVTSCSSKSADILIHAGGTSFQDIFVTEATCKQGSDKLRQVSLLNKMSLDEPVYQIISSSWSTSRGLLCARQKNKCLLLHTKDAGHKLVQKDHVDIPNELLTSVNFSPYMDNELLLSTKTGSIYLWNINTSSLNHLLVKTQDSKIQEKWSCSYFGGHPRHIVVADTTSVTMFDHRSHFNDGVDLFSLSPTLTKKEESIMAVTTLGFPYHAVVTDYAAFIMDQRFPLAPVLQWSTELISSPQYVQVLHQQDCLTEQKKMLFIASQQPPEVMCFPLTTEIDHSPTSPVIPWRLSQIGDFCQSNHTSYPYDLKKTESRFQASLAGVAVSNRSTENGFTIYQTDSYGDIFYQTLVHKSEDLFCLESCTEEERQAVDEHAESWLRAFERTAKHEPSQLQCLSVNLAPNVWNDIFSPTSSEIRNERKQIYPTLHKKVHMNLKTIKQLSCKGSSAKLHLALREKTDDVMEILKKREDDHAGMRKKARTVNFKEQKNKKGLKKLNTTSRNYKNIKNVDDVMETDAAADRGNTATRDLNRSTSILDECDRTLVTGTFETKDIETVSESMDSSISGACESLEESHAGMKKKAKTVNLKELKGKKGVLNKRKYKKKKKVSSRYCKSDTSDDDDDAMADDAAADREAQQLEI